MAKNITVFSILSLIVFFYVWFNAKDMELNLSSSSLMTGYILLAFMLGIALFNLRKKLSMLPLGNASVWLAFHVVGGFLCLGFFWIHTQTDDPAFFR